MRYPVCLLLLTGALLGSTMLVPLHAEDSPTITVNAQVSSRSVCMNQAVRVEFVTLPRQVQNIDISQAVFNAITMTAHDTWRLLGKVAVLEHERTHTIDIAFTVLPRMSGSLLLPQIPLTWVRGDQIADFGQVKVAEKIQVGTDQLELPHFCLGVAGFSWGTKLADVRTVRIPDNQIKVNGENAVATTRPGLQLEFRNGQLGAAVIDAPGLTIDQARQSFFAQWGLPQFEDPEAVTWIVGWTSILATENPSGTGGIEITVTREDIQDHLDQAKVKAAVFDVIDGPVPVDAAASDAALKTKQKQEDEDFYKEQQERAAEAAAPAPAPITPSAPPVDAAPPLPPPTDH